MCHLRHHRLNSSTGTIARALGVIVSRANLQHPVSAGGSPALPIRSTLVIEDFIWYPKFYGE